MPGECVRITSDTFPPPDNQLDNSQKDDGEQTYSEENCHIYLRKFEGSPAIPGLVTNVVAIFRQDFQADPVTVTDPLVLDLVRREEKEMTTEICRYLVQNGTNDIQVVSNFSEYMKPIEQDLTAMQNELGVQVRRTERLKGEDSTDVTVVLLLSCCGQFQQIKMGRLVIDSYKASRLGVVIIGNTALLNDNFDVPAWGKLLKMIREDGTLKDHLDIVCMKHRVVNRQICNARDLQLQSPSGGCSVKCGKLDCGHQCPYVCHPIDPNHTSEVFRCWEKCTKKCPSGHKCMKYCWENCDKCAVVVKIQLPCEHFWETDKVIYCHEQPAYRCMVMVNKELKCGHFMKMACSADASTYKCQQLVGGLLKCGHGYTFKCWEEDVSKVKCQIPRQVSFKCGHSVFITCHQEKIHGKNLSCEKICAVKLKCGHECGRPCHLEDPEHLSVKCEKPCARMCPRRVHSCRGKGKGHVCSEPCKPCDEPYDFPLGCGHFYRMRCSDKSPDQNYVCTEPCIVQHPFCRHRCEKMCSEDCGRCQKVITKVAGNCPRKHFIKLRCQERAPDKCETLILPKVAPDCGHPIRVYCYEADTITKQELSEICHFPCKSWFDQENECGHKCRGTCANCFQGRFHVRCKEPCGKVLICGHSCTSPCGMECPPCRYSCVNYCDHSKCEYECGVPCVRNCKEPCTYMCKHSKCSKLCSEVCDKEICYEPCEKVLPCGHPCVGFCGESCPPYCRLCSPVELLNGSFSGNQEVGAEDRFIYLKDCRHCIESEALESWISVKTDQILPIRCPICNARISWIHRYSSIMTANFELINAVRIKIFGNLDEIESILLDVRNDIEIYTQQTDASKLVPEYSKRILKQLDLPVYAAPKPEEDLQSISLQKAKFFKWICNEWISATQILAEFNTKLLTDYYEGFKEYWDEYLFEMIYRRVWPLHPNEIRALRIERKRLGHIMQLYSRMSINQNGRASLMTNEPGMKVFQQAEDVLLICKPYTEQMKKEFLKYLKQLDGILQCTIQITESERVEIVRAFGEGSGRWFKCENGHVYVVTECGGATEVGQCNECGASVGGQNHTLVEQNYLATEMDGAQQPLYPTVLIRNRN